MLWTLRSPSVRRLQPCLSRRISFTPNFRYPRIPASKSTPTFREHLAKTSPPKSFAEYVKPPSIRNQIIFFLVGSFAVFTLAAEQSNAETAFWSKRLADSSLMWRVREPTSDELRRVRNVELGKKLQAGLASLKEKSEGFSQTMRSLAVWGYIQVFQPILDAPDGKRACWAIGVVNAAIWAAWQIPRLRPTMMKHFTHNPLSGLSYTLITSMFSHKSFLHLLFNFMALSSFGHAATVYFAKQQQQSPSGLREANVTWHFLAFYLSAGMYSGLVSHIVTAKILYPRIISRVSSQAKPTAAISTSNATKAAAVGETSAVKAVTEPAAESSKDHILPSLGASGAIYAAVTLTALAFPNTEIALMIPPSFPIPIQWGVGGLVALDIIGVLRGWRLFDHWAHLGGAMFGVWYYNYGPRMWDIVRASNLGISPDAPRHPEVPSSEV